SATPSEVAAINETVFTNLKIYFGFTKSGMKLRNLMATQVSPLYLGLNPKSGAIQIVAVNSAEAQQPELTVVSVDVSRLTQLNEPRLSRLEIYGELESSAKEALQQTLKLANRLDQVHRIKLWESIT